MFFAVVIGEFGFINAYLKSYETEEACRENFQEAWTSFNQYSAGSKPKQYGIAQIVSGVEMVEPPRFAAAPLLTALPSPKP